MSVRICIINVTTRVGIFLVSPRTPAPGRRGGRCKTPSSRAPRRGDKPGPVGARMTQRASRAAPCTGAKRRAAAAGRRRTPPSPSGSVPPSTTTPPPASPRRRASALRAAPLRQPRRPPSSLQAWKQWWCYSKGGSIFYVATKSRIKENITMHF